MACVHQKKNSPPHGCHNTCSDQVSYNWKLNVISRVSKRQSCFPTEWIYVLQTTETICKLIQDIVGTHGLAKFNKDWTIKILTRFYYSNISHVLQPPGTIIELVQDIIGTHDLTIVKEVLFMTQKRQKAIAKAHHEHVVLS
ncbi:hypothetical protein DPMN_034179 [Dreissena polymorpha]|uniref:Uncharacterized protein n=1 Tax=Dreissena polymorpha TaxID=45954 RepID=A0A9D4M750_DREPO|nr:hypothetical protein DPMN_034179 [Dreissena polymorpha]